MLLGLFVLFVYFFHPIRLCLLFIIYIPDPNKMGGGQIALLVFMIKISFVYNWDLIFSYIPSVVPNFHRMSHHLEVVRVRRVRWWIYTGQYIGSLKQIHICLISSSIFLVRPLVASVRKETQVSSCLGGW